MLSPALASGIAFFNPRQSALLIMKLQNSFPLAPLDERRTMSLPNIIKNQLIEVIEWNDDSRDTLSYCWPDDDKEIKNSAQLIVRKSQQVQFVGAGQYADLFQPSKHTLSTENVPVLSTILGWK